VKGPLGGGLDRKKMSVKHEKDVAKLLGGRVPRGSGNQWHNPTDGVSPHGEVFAFSWDCKATMANSFSLTRMTWQKIREQASGLRPAVPVRFYDDFTFRTYVDLIVVDLNDFVEMKNRIAELEAEVERLKAGQEAIF
jgi:hypothetical protein